MAPNAVESSASGFTYLWDVNPYGCSSLPLTPSSVWPPLATTHYHWLMTASPRTHSRLNCLISFGSRDIASVWTQQRTLPPTSLPLLCVHIHCQGDMFTEPLCSNNCVSGSTILLFRCHVTILRSAKLVAWWDNFKKTDISEMKTQMGVCDLETGLGDALINIPYERESRHQIRHATVHLLNTVLVYKPHMCHLWDQWLHCVGTVLVHIHNPVPCIMMLNISCIIMECPICMLQQHTWNTLNPLLNTDLTNLRFYGQNSSVLHHYIWLICSYCFVIVWLICCVCAFHQSRCKRHALSGTQIILIWFKLVLCYVWFVLYYKYFFKLTYYGQQTKKDKPECKTMLELNEKLKSGLSVTCLWGIWTFGFNGHTAISDTPSPN
jgi:hypothetical protein